MPRRFKQRKRKIALPPGSLVYIGEKEGEARIRVINYEGKRFEEKLLEAPEECENYKDLPGVTWIDLEGIHQVDWIEKIGKCFGIHPLVLEDIVATDQRPKMEDFEKYVFIVTKAFYLRGGRIVPEQVSFLLLPGLLISFQERESDLFQSLRERLKDERDVLRSAGVDYLLYSLLDLIIDGYFLVIDRIGEEIEPLEEKALTNPEPQIVRSIQDLKRKLLLLRETLWASREIIARLERGESSLVGEATRLYFRDIHDHVFNLIEATETLRDMLSGMLDIYLSSISNRLNEVMKVLTIIATIFMPLTFIAGIYGMNFRFMPELGWKWGYPVVLSVMFLLGVGMYFYFKRKGWL